MASVRQRSTQRLLYCSLVGLGLSRAIAGCADTTANSGPPVGEGGEGGGPIGAGGDPTGATGGVALAGSGGSGGRQEPSGAGEAGAGGSLSAAGAEGGTGNPTGLGGAGGEGGDPSVACDAELVVLSEAPKAWALAIAGGYAYFTTRALDGEVLRVSVSGGNTEDIAAGELFPHALAVNDDSVFWSSLNVPGGQLSAASLTGETRTDLTSGLESGIFSLSADADNVYFVTNFNVLYRQPANGDERSQLTGGPYNSFIVDVVYDGAELFWTSNGVSLFQAPEPQSAGVFSVLADGSVARTPLVSLLDAPQFQIAVNAESAFYNDEVAIYRTTRIGGTPTPLVESLPPVWPPVVDMVADDAQLFYTDGQDLYQVPVAGGSPTRLTQGWSRITQLGLDEDYVYFTDYVRGQVVKIAKCAASTGPIEPLAPIQPPVVEGGGEGGASNDGAGGQGGEGATCAHGCPEPTPIATTTAPWGVAVDQDYVYFSKLLASGSIQRVPVAGGAPEPFADNEPWPHDITIDDTNVYWCLNDTQNGNLAKAPKAGGGRQHMTSGAGGGIGRVTSDGSFVYFLTGFSGLHRIPVDGGARAVAAAGPWFSAVTDIAQYDGELFWVNDGVWTNNTYTQKFPETAYVGRTPTSGSTDLGHTALDLGLTSPLYRVAVDALYVYYIDDELVYRADRRGGPIDELAPLVAGTTQVIDMHSDGTHLYFADLKSVYRVAVAGGDVETLTYGWGSLRGIAIDDHNVYFTDYAGGAVLKRPK